MTDFINSRSKTIRTREGMVADCIKDHLSYIQSYVGKEGRAERIKEYKLGKRRHKEIKKIMHEVTKIYPRFTSFMLDPQNSTISTDDIQKDILKRLKMNGAMTGGLDPATIDKMKKFFIEGAKNNTEHKNQLTEVLALMTKIEKDLKNVDNSNIDPNAVLNNLIYIKAHFTKYLNDSKVNKEAINVPLPLKTFIPTEYEDSKTLRGIIINIIDEYLKLLSLPKEVKEYIISVYNSSDDDYITSNTGSINDQSLKKNIERIAQDEIKNATKNTNNGNILFKNARNKLTKAILASIKEYSNNRSKTDIEKDNAKAIKYRDQLEKINVNRDEINKLKIDLEHAVTETNSYLYGEKSTDEYPCIASYIIPKFRVVVDVLKLYAKSITDDKDKDKEIINSLVRIYDKIMNEYYNDPEEGFKYKNIMDSNNDTLIENIKTIITPMPATPRSQRHAPATGIRVKAAKVLFSPSAKINDARGTIKNVFISFKEDQIKKCIMAYTEKKKPDMVKFIEKYNEIMSNKEEDDGGNTLIKRINIYYYKCYVNYLTSVDSALATLVKENIKKDKYIEMLKIIIVNMSTVTDPSKTISDDLKQAFKKFIESDDITESTNKKFTKIYNEINKIMKEGYNDDEKSRNFIHAYNKYLNKIKKDSPTDMDTLRKLGLSNPISLIPSAFFVKEYTDRIDNNIFGTYDPNAITKLKIIETYTENGDNNINIRSLYKPNFIEMLPPKGQAGGSNYAEIFGDITHAYILHGTALAEYKNASEKYTKAYNDVYTYTLYLISIATNQLFTENYVVYKYINKGLIELYKRILNKMIDDVEKGSGVAYKYIQKYYIVVIKRLNRFFNEISQYMNDPTEIIDIYNIDSTTPEIRNNMILLNYFKPIIEKYNETFQNKVTVYARLNDIRGAIDYNSKIFVSDHEKYKATGCDYKKIKSITAATAPTIQNECNKKGDSDMGGDSSIMWVRKATCKNTRDTLEFGKSNIPPADYITHDNEHKFTEVFDTVNFPDNSDIAKYMTLETQLGNKKGVCIMTYGYSGTGKTYTLFGNKNTQGVLQSTLVTINNLYRVKFRLFEIYGRGFTYDFYWNEKDAASGKDISRLNKIFHRIYHYNLENTGTNIQVQNGNDDNKIIEVMPDKFSAYMKDEDGYDPKSQSGEKHGKTYTTISSDQISSIFGNFSEFTNSIDTYRKKTERIRETPNNPESSRSVLIYDFKLYVGTEKKDDDRAKDDAVSFLIVDLPGREEIDKTYVNPYLNNATIKEILEKCAPVISTDSAAVADDKNVRDYRDFTLPSAPTKQNPREEMIRMTITCMALNPIALAVFYGDLIVNTVNTNWKKFFVGGTEKEKKDNRKKFMTYVYSETGKRKGKKKTIGDELSDIVAEGKKLSDIVIGGTPLLDIIVNDRKVSDIVNDVNDEGIKFSDMVAEGIIKFSQISSEDNKKISDMVVYGKNLSDIHVEGIKLSNIVVGGKKLSDIVVEDEKYPFLSLKNEPLVGYRTKYQRDGFLSIFIMCYLVESNNFDMISLIYKDILNKVLNNCIDAWVEELDKNNNDIMAAFESLKVENFKNMKFISEYEFLMKDRDANRDKIKTLLKETLHYDYLLTPLEGIYINENIIGLIKYIAKEFIIGENEHFAKVKIMQEKIYLKEMRDIARFWLASHDEKNVGTALNLNSINYNDIKYTCLYDANKHTRGKDIYVVNNGKYITTSGTSSIKNKGAMVKLAVDVNVLVTHRIWLTNLYKSQKIFNFDKPLIADILAPYVSKKPKTEDYVIGDYKLFYLFGNYDDDNRTQYKCDDQINLLDNTANFIEAVTK